ncbi:unnamed protein product, partial [Rotaria magnacalcarata]
ALTTHNPCAIGDQFMCMENGHCIDKRKVCDFKIDCPTPGGSDEAQCGTCTFDNNNGTLCGWEDRSFSDLNWVLATGATNMGPSSDHTTGNGFYITVPPNNLYKFASLRSQTVGPAGVECQLKFSYYMNTQTTMNSSKISVYIRNENDNFTSFTYIANIYHSTGPEWKQNVINIGYQSRRFFIEIDGIPYEKTAIAIDDVEFYNCQSETTPELGLSINCTFENGWCNFFQNTTADFQWTRTNIQTSSSNTGPNFDHTSGSGYYVFIEASSPRIPGDHARLISALQYPSSTAQRLTFWYHMYGSDIGTLNVFVQMISTDLNSTSSTFVWTKSGTHGNQWHRATQTLYNLNSTDMYGWRIAFDGVVGDGFLGDIALDDIAWSPNTICSAEEITTTLSQPVASTTYRKIIDSLAIDDVEMKSGVCKELGSCDFENDLCGFQNLRSDFTWKLTSHSTDLLNTLEVDHTTNSQEGFYLWIDREQSVKGQKARIESEPMPIGIRCISFWSYLNNTVSAELNVYIYDLQLDIYNLIWSTNKPSGPFWVYRKITAPPILTLNRTTAYTIVYEAIVGSKTGDFAIDDLLTQPGACTPTTTDASSTKLYTTTYTITNSNSTTSYEPLSTTTGPWTTRYTGSSTTGYTGSSTTGYTGSSPAAGPSTTRYTGSSTTRYTGPSITGDTHPLTAATIAGSESIALLISSYTEESTLQTGSLLTSDSNSATLSVINELTTSDSLHVTSNSYIVCAEYVCFNGGTCKLELGAAICE